MMNHETNLKTGCILCGKAIRYEGTPIEKTCHICGKKVMAQASCVEGHFVCDSCHTAGVENFLMHLKSSKEKNPFSLLQQLFLLPQVHMHGPEHHMIVPCVMLTAFHNNGGEIDLSKALKEALKRGKQVPGGTCGFWGACGSALGAGIYASIATESSPLNENVWHLPTQLTANCLSKMAEIGGPRCCKRTSFISTLEAIRFTEEKLGITIPGEVPRCDFSSENKECIEEKCPFYRI